jgi:DNA polymerase sigma
MNINTPLGLMNTKMIKTYVSIDPRVRPFAMIIKHWARRRVLNDAGITIMEKRIAGWIKFFYSKRM